MNIELISTFLTGALVSGSLIVAIGSQNAFLLKCGLRNVYPFYVATLCFLGDILMINIGIFGVGHLFSKAGIWRDTLVIVGVIFLSAYGLMSLYYAWVGNKTLQLDHSTTKTSLATTVAMTLAMTFLNPHVYLDTLVLIGGITASLAFEDKIAFSIGALLASGLWFYGLAYLSKKLIPLFTNPRAWRFIDLCIALIMFGIAAQLLSSF